MVQDAIKQIVEENRCESDSRIRAEYLNRLLINRDIDKAIRLEKIAIDNTFGLYEIALCNNIINNAISKGILLCKDEKIYEILEIVALSVCNFSSYSPVTVLLNILEREYFTRDGSGKAESLNKKELVQIENNTKRRMECLR